MSTDAVETSLKAEFGPVGRQLAERYFEPVRFPAPAVQTLADLHAKGFVVHVMRTTAWLNYLYLTWALIKHGLPPVRAVVNLRRWFTRPWVRTAQRGDFEVRFTYARVKSGSGLVFLKETVFGSPDGKLTDENPFPALVDLAKKSDRPVFLVPELFVWEKWNQSLTPSIFDRLFGSPEAPGFLHSLLVFLRNYHRAQFRVGEAINLNAFIAENPGDSTSTLARKVRSALGLHLARETRAVFGPPAKSTERLIAEAMRDRVLRKSLEEAAHEKGKSLDAVTREAKKNFQAIAARYRPSVVAAAVPLLHWVFNRIYDGILVDEEGLERAMKVAAKAPVVLTPSHKSHIDYLVMSFVLWQRGYSVPLVAAGANLSFFPLGTFLRRGGAFFLRRSFKGDKVYQATFKAYLKKLVHDGVHHEFFPEGGRSRTGKLLTPKLGLFSWLVDAVLEGARDDLFFVPVAIDYEKVVEGRSFSAELKGGEKKTEDLKALLTAPKVLTERYGRIHLSFDEPISLKALMKERGVRPDAAVADENKKALVRALGNRVMYGVSRVSTVTPHALLASALLAHRRRGITATEISERVQLLRRIATDLGAKVSPLLHDAPSSPSSLGPLADAMRSFAAQGMVKVIEANGDAIYQTVDEKRAELSFNKNTLLNLVAGRTIVACAILGTEPAHELNAVKDRALWLSRLFKLEFIYPAGQSFESIFDKTVEHLTSLGLVVRHGTELTIAPEPFARPLVQFIADLVRDYLESYLLVAMASAELTKESAVEKKAFVRRTLERGRGEFLAGKISAAESLSQPTLQNAVQLLLEQKILAESGQTIHAGTTPATPLVELIRSTLGA